MSGSSTTASCFFTALSSWFLSDLAEVAAADTAAGGTGMALALTEELETTAKAVASAPAASTSKIAKLSKPGFAAGRASTATLNILVSLSSTDRPPPPLAADSDAADAFLLLMSGVRQKNSSSADFLRGFSAAVQMALCPGRVKITLDFKCCFGGGGGGG